MQIKRFVVYLCSRRLLYVFTTNRSAMQLSTLTDSELLQRAWASHDGLTRTDLEAELLKRFEEMAEQVAVAQPLIELLEERDIDDADALKTELDKAAALDERQDGLALLDVLREFEIDDHAELRKALERDAAQERLRELAQTATDALAELNTLFITAD